MSHSIRRVTYATLATGAVAASLLVAAATHSTTRHASWAGSRVHFANVFVAAPRTIKHTHA